MQPVIDTLTQSWDFLTAAFGPMGPFFALGGIGALLIALSIPALLKRNPDPLDKLGGVGGNDRRKAEKGDEVRLLRPAADPDADIVVDRVRFGTDEPWPVEASGGVSQPSSCSKVNRFMAPSPPSAIPLGANLPRSPKRNASAPFSSRTSIS